MYAEYAKDPRMKLNIGIRRRLGPLLDGGRDEVELMHAILFSLPGSPVLYYGDEIGMGDNVFLGDRDGVRTPMQWTGDRNGGFSRADFAQLYLPPLMDPCSASRPSTSRPSCARRPRCCAGCAASSSCARSTPCSGSARTRRCDPTTHVCSPTCARTRATPCCASTTCRALGAGRRARSRAVRGPRPGGDDRRRGVPRRSASSPTSSRWRRAASSGSSSIEDGTMHEQGRRRWAAPSSSTLVARPRAGLRAKGTGARRAHDDSVGRPRRGPASSSSSSRCVSRRARTRLSTCARHRRRGSLRRARAPRGRRRRLAALCRHRERVRDRAADRRRAIQQLGHARRAAHAQGLPAARGRPEPRARDAPRARRRRASRTRLAWRARSRPRARRSSGARSRHRAGLRRGRRLGADARLALGDTVVASASARGASAR